MKGQTTTYICAVLYAPSACPNPSQKKSRHSPRASSLNIWAGGLLCPVDAVLMSIVRAGEGTCEGGWEGSKAVGNGGR